MTWLQAFDWALLTAAALCVAVMLPRLSAMVLWRHKCAPVVLHAMLTTGCMLAGFAAWFHEADLIDLVAVLSTLAWWRLSLHSWDDGVPKHYRRGENGA